MFYTLYMPTINIYKSGGEYDDQLNHLINELKELVAKELSGNSIQLDTNEVSVRIIDVAGNGGMLAKVEVEINAAAFDERVKRQDQICLEIQKFLIERLSTDVKVWLILSELGHSWE